MKNTRKLSSKVAEPRWFRAVALLIAAVASTAGSLLASSDDAWKEFRTDISTKMESAIAGKFASHSLFIEPTGSESYGLAVASGVSAGDKRRLTIFGVYKKETMTLEIIEVPETTFEEKVAAASDKNPGGTNSKGIVKSTAALLQGKWRHTEDKNNLLVFKDNVRKESSDGGKTWEETTFVVEDHCTNAGDAAGPKKASKDLFISTVDDFCWSIDLVNGTKLSLTYVGRGNTLRYDRVTN